ncbi:hypothetical protein CO180_03715 [candidate division WWE3 bacterium CG_4_9_14_3_um_filter_41_6]|uniref:Uncharacterized protein n=1 Tax=candidate division WWE3 bacterium CG_4_10_14_0_2_um_filter_41_14 TaxID=1975072 RepID=A0A2M7TLP8_UNCKA|nr:MAG: hypothetical protein COY32_00670 [candidate division WWE3 bacterium CG_4_10_14_0_2_um_filter_41_14]PJA38356.1 MAG: hypothetical protein CO180_03715 [candidate division WWE3 bacterium CG_4_9_14_3_um_filter_41_6]
MSIDTAPYKIQLEKLLEEVTQTITRVEASDPANNEFRDSDNTMEDDYSESEQGFRANELLDDLSEKRDLIVSALVRIEDGTYGMDIDTGEPINPARLAAVPYATHAMSNEQESEKTEE